jgi:hypothetical protein
MAGGPQGDLLEAPDAAQDAEGFEAVGVDDLALAGVQPARLVEDLVGHPQLAQVVQQRGDLEPADVPGLEAEALAQVAGQPGDADRMLGGEGALGVDDAREDLAQPVQLVGRRGEHAVDALRPQRFEGAGFEHQPEGLGPGGLEEDLDQLRRKVAAGVLGDPGADFFGEQQQRLVAVVGRRQGIHPIHQIDQVGLALDAGRQREILQHIPAGVVVEDGQGHRLERRKPLTRS